MLAEAKWLEEHADRYEALSAEAEVAGFSGKLEVAREKFLQAAAVRSKQGLREAAASTATEEALLEAVIGNFRQAQTGASAQVAAAQKTNVLINGMLAFSLSGAAVRAEALSEKLRAKYPRDTGVNSIFVPIATAALHLSSGKSHAAVDVLQATGPYELGASADFLPMYLRGQAYLNTRSGLQAAAEFRKILDHRGVDLTSVLYPLAHLGLARACVLQGNTAKARAEYQEFSTLWKDADPDIPILRQAKAEYARLQ